LAATSEAKFSLTTPANEYEAYLAGRPCAVDTSTRNTIIKKNQNTFAKRRREMDKKAKAEAKRARRLQRKQDDDADNLPATPDGLSDTPDIDQATPN
jgi:hypothetical protein